MKGWIEVTDVHNGKKTLVSLNASLVIISCEDRTIIQFPSSTSEYRIYDISVKETYEELKQKIKEAR